jgi:hypothetical protein
MTTAMQECKLASWNHGYDQGWFRVRVKVSVRVKVA